MTGPVSLDNSAMLLLERDSDSTVRESARTQNVLTEIADGIWPTRIVSTTLMDRWIVDTAHNGFSVGDIALCLTQYDVTVPDPAHPDQYWTNPGAETWVKIFDSATNSDVMAVGAAVIDPNFATLDESGVVYKTSSSRTVTRRALDASLNESMVTATETRTVQASHIYPYQTIFDSGWV